MKNYEETIMTALTDYFTEDEAKKIYDNGYYFIYDNCYDMSDVAYQIMEESGFFTKSTPDIFQRYFDFESFGRDLDIEGIFIYLGNARYLEVVY